MTSTLHTYVGQKAACQKANRYLRNRNVLSKTETIKHGHYRFVMLVPHTLDEPKARMMLADAFHGVFYEPPVWTPDALAQTEARAAELLDDRTPTRKALATHIATEDKRSKQPQLGAHMATLNLFREADGTYHITVAEARGFIDGWKGEPMRAAPIYYVEQAIIEAAANMSQRHERDKA